MPFILDRKEIAAALPHKGVLLLPQTFECFFTSETLCARGTMHIRKNNFFVQRHFGFYPGVMMIEFLNQIAALSIMLEKEISGNPIVCRLEDPGPTFGRFKTVSGDRLYGTISLTKSKRGMYYFQGKVFNQKEEQLLTTGIVGAAAEKKVQNNLAILAEAENIKI